MDSQKCVALLTLIALERDSRSYQTAASLGRFGYRSIVVEGEPSELSREELPFELVTVEGAVSLRATAGVPDAASDGSSDSASGEPPTLRRRVLVSLPVPVARLAIRLHRIWARGKSRLSVTLLRSFRRSNELTYRSTPAADLYYLTFFWQFPAVWRRCERHGVGFIYDVNDAHWRWPSYQWYPRLFRAFLRAVERRCVRRAAAFITVSDGVADLFERRYGRRPTVVRNLHDLRIDERVETDVRGSIGLSDDAFLLVVVGNDKPSDATGEALEAMTKLPDRVHLALMGRGYEDRVPEIRRLGLERRVHLVPPVLPNEVTDAIRGADASLVNTRARDVHLHALPTRLFSSVAAGLPILYPTLPEVKALAEDHALGLQIDTEDPESIASAVRDLSESPELVAAYRANVKQASRILNWENEEARIAEIVSGALGGPAMTPRQSEGRGVPLGR